MDTTEHGLGNGEADDRELPSQAERAEQTVEADEPRRPSRWLAVVSACALALTVLGSFALTDDHWPFAPFRMFSVGNNPNGVVRRMILEADTETGRHRTIGADGFGLRRAELEEQTPWDRWVANDRLTELVEGYNRRHDVQLVHVQVVVFSTQMRNGEPDGPETRRVIGDWAAPSWTGERAERDLPIAPPWPGYGS